jgi:phosphotransferase system IIB component
MGLNLKLSTQKEATPKSLKKKVRVVQVARKGKKPQTQVIIPEKLTF